MMLNFIQGRVAFVKRSLSIDFSIVKFALCSRKNKSALENLGESKSEKNKEDGEGGTDV